MPIVKSNVLTENVIEVPSAETDKVIQAFPLERANPRFREGVRIRRLHRSLHDANTCTVEQSIKRRRKLRVTITDQEPGFDTLVIQPHLHISRLLHYPLPIQVIRRRAHEDLPRLQMSEKQAVRRSSTKWRDDVFREEVACDERVHVVPIDTQSLSDAASDRRTNLNDGSFRARRPTRTNRQRARY